MAVQLTVETDAEIAARIRRNAAEIAEDMKTLVQRGWRPAVHFSGTVAYANGVTCEWKPEVSITRGQPEHL